MTYKRKSSNILAILNLYAPEGALGEQEIFHIGFHITNYSRYSPIALAFLDFSLCYDRLDFIRPRVF